MAPWVTIGSLALLFFGWLCYGYYTRGRWSLMIPRPEINRGIAPQVVEEDLRKEWYKKWTLWILDNI